MQECNNFEIALDESAIKIHKSQKEFFNDLNLIKFHFHILRLYHVAQKEDFDYFKFTFTELYEKLCLSKTF